MTIKALKNKTLRSFAISLFTIDTLSIIRKMKEKVIAQAIRIPREYV